MRIAIVHDYLVNRGGAERVVAAFHRAFPDAPIFTALYAPEHTHPDFQDADVRTSGLQKLMRRPEDFRRLAPLMPRAFRRMRIEGFDLILSSTSGFAHGAHAKDTCHVTYCHTPPRFLWDTRYDRGNAVPALMRPAAGLAVRALRRSDHKAAKRPHFTLANSALTASRIKSLYGREATVLHPPVDVSRFAIAPNTKDQYLLVSRLLSYKNIDVAIKAFNQMNRTLIIVGDGPAKAELQSIAGPTIQFRGVVDDGSLVRLYGQSRGMVVAAEEDFGLTPLEANASGRPVIALKAGGALETVLDGATGVFFEAANPFALMTAVDAAERIHFDPAVLRAHAEQFSEQAFAGKLKRYLEDAARACMTCARTRRSRKVAHLRAAPRIPASEIPPAQVKTP